uniref:Uncharacterized protein n=1 Tax=Lepeophtheirus salmonis TaxID=72036 RepID=A0A0K2THR4_LEPSM
MSFCVPQCKQLITDDRLFSRIKTVKHCLQYK